MQLMSADRRSVHDRDPATQREGVRRACTGTLTSAGARRGTPGRAAGREGPSMRRIFVRMLTPTGFVLTGLCLVLPFVTVSCDAPGGFGRAEPGGTTTYSGVDLVSGGGPTVDKLLPAAQQHGDRLGVQPLAVVFVLLLVAGAVATWLIRERQRRRITAAALAAVGIMLLAANQVTTSALLQARLSEQLAVPMPAGKRAADYVHTDGGFAVCLLALLILLATNLVAWAGSYWRTRRARAGTPDAPPAGPIDPLATTRIDR
jgi:hypothetical protein